MNTSQSQPCAETGTHIPSSPHLGAPVETALRDAVADLLALERGDISGPSQRAGIIREAEAALAAADLTEQAERPCPTSGSPLTGIIGE